MSEINSWNTRETAILSVLFPILFTMSEETTTPVDETVVPATEETCTDESCTHAEEAAPESPTETEATPAE
jgi:hypothetical protein